MLPTIMLVEDERIVALSIQQQLRRLGYNVPAVACSGDQALQMVGEIDPDLVLMDIHIEGVVDGIEVARSLQADRDIPVVYLTAYSDDATLARARTTKPYGYMMKPFSERELHATVQMALERHQNDIAEKERHMLRLREAEMRAALDAALEASRAKTRFLAAASHDLRQPLHAIGLYVDSLRTSPLPVQVKATVDDIKIALTSMQNMFNSLLDFIALDSGLLVAQPVGFLIQGLADELRINFAPIAREKGIDLTIQEAPIVVKTDRIFLRGILQNLISNAIAYTAKGGVSVRFDRVGEEFLITVSDTGRGIPADRIDDIFEEFVRLDHGGSPPDGMGLGLAIVRRQANLLGARLKVESVVGVGSAFTVVVPYLPNQTASPPPQVGSPATSLRGRTILIVDNNPLVRSAMATRIESWGAQSLTAASVTEALAVLEQPSPKLPDATVVDFNLGNGMSGLSFLDEIAKRYSTAIASVIVTGAITPEVQASLRASGRKWLTKPVDSDVLYKLLTTILAEANNAAKPMP
jgi:signal transduction histidine kinase